MSLTLDELKRDVSSGNVVAMVGAGVSLAATRGHSHASWLGLLESGVAHCRRYDVSLDNAWEKRVLREIRSKRIEDLLSAAEKITTRLHGPDGGEYRNWLRETIGHLRASDRSILNALRDLGVPLATTNYDGLLVEATGLLPITWRDGPLVIDWLQGKVAGIFHFHGFWRAAESVVLGIRSYQDIVRDPHVQEAVRALLATKAFLFVGFGAGLQDPNFVQLRQWMRQLLAGVTTCHCRLALQKEQKRVQQEHAPEERIKVIAFGEQHEDLAAFLHRLRPNRSAPRPHIPPQRPCCGRVKLIDHLVNAVLDQRTRLIPLLGGPALGKTTAAIGVLHHPQVAEKYGTRRYYVNCAGTTSRADVVAKIAQATQVMHSPYIEDAVLSALGSEPAILVLDDTETPWQVNPNEIQDLLATLVAVRGLVLLAVFRGTQRPLCLDWYPPVFVLPLELAVAREVFLRVAGTEFAGDPLLDQFLDAVGGVPYAVTLLGYLAQTEPNLEGLWNRWCIERTKLLQGPLVGEDYQRMAASFEVSISAPTVSCVSRRLLSILAMLPDGMSVEEIVKVFPDLGEEACCTLRKAALVLPREPRLRLHGLLREHVREKHPPQADHLRRAVDYYADLAIRAERQFGARDSHKAVARFAANLSNIECMIHTALHGAVELKVIEAAGSLAAFICLTGAGSRELVSTAAGMQTSMSPLARAHFLRNYADLETRYGDHERARELYEEACKLFKSIDNMEGAADCIKKTADLQRHAGKFKKAAEGYDWALNVQAEHQNLVGQAGCIAGLADVAMAAKSYFEARSNFTDAMHICRAAENHAGMAYCTMRMGYAALAQGEPEEACKHFEEAIPWADDAYDLLIKNSAIQGLGMAKVECSQFDQAEACFRDTLPFFRRADDTFGIAGCLRGLGDVARSRSDYRCACEHYLDALQVYHRGQHWPDVAEMCRRLASVAPSDHERATYEMEARKADDKARGGVPLGA